jgi:hypothetical protein
MKRCDTALCAEIDTGHGFTPRLADFSKPETSKPLISMESPMGSGFLLDRSLLIRILNR